MATITTDDIRGNSLPQVHATCGACGNCAVHALDRQRGRDWYECQRCGNMVSAEQLRQADGRINRRG